MKRVIDIQEQKKILIGIMDEIDAFCRANKIKYFLLGGSLIGAVRHKGFIPWDDDIDIGLLRPDYEKFIDLFPKKNNAQYLKLLSLETDTSYGYPFAKVVDDRTALIEAIDCNDELGVYVDIFPIDNCSSLIHEAQKFVGSFSILRWLRNFKIIPIEKRRGFFKNLILVIGKILALPIPRRTISIWISNRAKRFINDNSKYVAQMSGNVYGVKEIWEKTWFNNCIESEFEGRYYFIPKEYHLVLSQTFGDYMKLPPLDRQVSHHDFVAYWK